MDCKILWNELDAKGWHDRLGRCGAIPITQSVPYALAASKMYGQRPRWGVILIGDQEVGLVQMMEASILWGLIHAVMIDRGPLWFEGCGTAGHVSLFWSEMNRQFPQRFMRKRRFIPEMPDGMAAQSVLKTAGLIHQDGSIYQTLSMNLCVSEDDLRDNLKKNWRGSLQKAERQNLDIEFDETGATLDWFLQYYAADKAARGYSGASVKMMRYLGHAFAIKKDILIGRVTHDGEPVAGILMFIHGNSATYQVGWCLDTGRSLSANHLLLWRSALALKSRGVTDFDLGGVNDESAKGVKKFKEGIVGKNNDSYQTLPGIFS